MNSRPESASWLGRSGPALLTLLGIILVSLNLRSAVTSLGAVLAEVSEAVGLSPGLAGVVTMLPTLSFAAAGGSAPWLARRFSSARILVAAMVVLAAGLVVRAATSSAVVFLVCTVLALAGIAVANVLLPALVRQHYPTRIGLATGVYTMCMLLGGAAAAAATVPVAELAGSWRIGLGGWAVFAVLAILPWLPAAIRNRRPPQRGDGTPSGVAPAGTPAVPDAVPGVPDAVPSGPGATPAAFGMPGTPDLPRATRIRPARSSLGWAMALYFGCQSLTAYAMMGWLPQLFRDAGYPAATAGLLLGVVIAIGVPVALVVPTLAARLPDLRATVLVFAVATGMAFVGLAVAPGSLAMLWVLILSVGQASFPLALVMIGLRARTAEGTVALSAFTQSVGYLIAGLGPLVTGVLYGRTGGWVLPMGFLILMTVVHAGGGLVAGRPRYIEDG